MQPALEAAGIQHTLHVTHSAGHAAEVAASLELQQYDALLMMGGDGTVHEALQVVNDPLTLTSDGTVHDALQVVKNPLTLTINASRRLVAKAINHA